MAEPPLIPGLNPITHGPGAVGNQQNPPPLPQSPGGAILQGTVLGADAKGNPIIQTEALRIVLRSEFALAKGEQVTLRLEQSLTKDHLPSVRITAVNGQPIAVPKPGATPQSTVPSASGTISQPASAQPPQAGAHAPVNPANAPVARAAAEAAKPVGVLLEAIARSPEQAAKAGEPGYKPPTDAMAAKETPQAPIQRAGATQIAVSGGARTTAYLLRAAATPQAPQLLQSFASAAGTPLPAPLAPEAALKPGLQLLVRVMNLTAPPAGTASPAPTMPAAAAQPQVATPQPGGSEVAGAASDNRAGYASYARQGAVSPQSATPTAPVPGMSGQASPPAANPSTPSPAMVANTPAAQTSPPPQPLSPAQVGELLVQAEAKPLPPGQMAGVVVGREQSGSLIVQTRLGVFSLPTPATEQAIKPGTTLVWEVREVQLPGRVETAGLPPLQGVAGAIANTSRLTIEGSALAELASVLQAAQSSEAAQALHRAIPHIGGNFSAGLLFFMSVLRRGDVHHWLGNDAVDMLERMGKGDLIPRLGADLASLRAMFVEQPHANWQALFFPVMADKELHQANMYFKREDEEDNKGKKGGAGTRFIVELDLSAMGAMQLDGFLKKREQQQYFDLVVRSLKELPDNVKNDITGIFTKAQEATGMAGAIAFRKEVEFPIHPLEEMESGDGGHDAGIVV